MIYGRHSLFIMFPDFHISLEEYELIKDLPIDEALATLYKNNKNLQAVFDCEVVMFEKLDFSITKIADPYLIEKRNQLIYKIALKEKRGMDTTKDQEKLQEVREEIDLLNNLAE